MEHSNIILGAKTTSYESIMPNNLIRKEKHIARDILVLRFIYDSPMTVIIAE